MYLPDGPDHGTADRVRRVEIAELLLGAQLGLSLDQASRRSPAGVGIRDGVTADRETLVGGLLEHQVVSAAYLRLFRDLRIEHFPVAQQLGPQQLMVSLEPRTMGVRVPSWALVLVVEGDVEDAHRWESMCPLMRTTEPTAES